MKLPEDSKDHDQTSEDAELAEGATPNIDGSGTLTRRQVLAQLGGAAGFVAITQTFGPLVSYVEARSSVSRGRKLSSAEIARETHSLTLDEVKTRLARRYPELKQSETYYFRNLALEARYENDELAQAYMRLGSYQDFLKDGFILKTDMIERNTYLNPDSMWKEKIRIACENHKEDCRRAYESVKPLGAGNGGMNLQKLMTSCREAEQIVKAKKDQAGISSTYDDIIDADLLMGIAIHEVIPVGYSSSARIGVLRALLEEGLEINKIPAIYDSVASFGPMQMTTMPYEGRDRGDNYRNRGGIGDIEPYLEDFGLPKRLHDCTDLNDQLIAGMILQFVNLQRFDSTLRSNDRFIELWEAATIVERRAFVATLLGTAHNNPANAKRALEQSTGWSRRDSADYFVDNDPATKEKVMTLDDLRIAYVNIAKRGHATSGRHGLSTGKLVAIFSEYEIDSLPIRSSVPPARTVASTTPEQPTVPSSREPQEPTLEIERTRYMLSRERMSKRYYTYTIPRWQLSRLFSALTNRMDDQFITEMKRFNKVTSFKPGDVIFIPIEYLKKELQGSEVIEIVVPEKRNSAEYAEEIVGKDLSDIVMIYSLQQARGAMPENLSSLRIPKGLINGNGHLSDPGQGLVDTNTETRSTGSRSNTDSVEHLPRTEYTMQSGDSLQSIASLLCRSMSQSEYSLVQSQIQALNPSVDFSQRISIQIPGEIIQVPRRKLEDLVRIWYPGIPVEEAIDRVKRLNHRDPSRDPFTDRKEGIWPGQRIIIPVQDNQ